MQTQHSFTGGKTIRTHSKASIVCILNNIDVIFGWLGTRPEQHIVLLMPTQSLLLYSSTYLFLFCPAETIKKESERETLSENNRRIVRDICLRVCVCVFVQQCALCYKHMHALSLLFTFNQRHHPILSLSHIPMHIQFRFIPCMRIEISFRLYALYLIFKLLIG